MKKILSPQMLVDYQKQLQSHRMEGRTVISVCAGTGCLACGCQNVIDALYDKLKKEGGEGKKAALWGVILSILAMVLVVAQIALYANNLEDAANPDCVDDMGGQCFASAQGCPPIGSVPGAPMLGECPEGQICCLTNVG